MKRIGRKDTAPELAVRRYLHARGLRFRLHCAELPGTPDIVMPSRNTAIYVNGCFWHGHDCAHGRIQSHTNLAYWDAKIADNRARDLRKSRALIALGWRVEVVWECESHGGKRLTKLADDLLRR